MSNLAKRTKAGLLILLAAMFFCPLISDAASRGPEDPFPQLASSYLLKFNNRILWAHRPDRKLPMASLTKIMSALIILDQGRMEDVVTIGRGPSRETGTRLGLSQGEKMRADFLLTAALVGSANDACRALAEQVGGNETGFVALMNRRAEKMGLKATHFQNASGHDHPKHYSTARDLSAIAEAALRTPVIAEKVKLATASVFTMKGRSFTVTNTNELIGRYPGALGVKTGFTAKAGKCLIAFAERDDSKVLLVLLNAPNRWWDAEAMLEEAFRQGEKRGPRE